MNRKIYYSNCNCNGWTTSSKETKPSLLHGNTMKLFCQRANDDFMALWITSSSYKFHTIALLFQLNWFVVFLLLISNRNNQTNRWSSFFSTLMLTWFLIWNAQTVSGIIQLSAPAATLKGFIFTKTLFGGFEFDHQNIVSKCFPWQQERWMPMAEQIGS